MEGLLWEAAGDICTNLMMAESLSVCSAHTSWGELVALCEHGTAKTPYGPVPIQLFPAIP